MDNPHDRDGCSTHVWSTVWIRLIAAIETKINSLLTHLCPPLRSTFAVRETASLGIMGALRVPPLNPSESIVLSEHYRLYAERRSLSDSKC